MGKFILLKSARRLAILTSLVVMSSCNKGLQSDPVASPGSGAGTGSGDSSGGGSGSGSSVLTAIRGIVSTGDGLNFNNLNGSQSDLVLNPVTKLPAVVYVDKGNTASGTVATGALRYSEMSSNGVWSVPELIDASSGGVACGTAGSTCIGAPNAAAPVSAIIAKLAFTSTGLPVIAYVYGQSLTGTNKKIQYAEKSTTGTWSTSTAYTAPTTVAVATIEPIKGLTLTMDSSNRPHITAAVQNSTITSSVLIYTTRASSTASWVSSTIAPAGFSLFSTAPTVAAGQGLNISGAAVCPVDGNLVLTGFQNNLAAAGGGYPWILKCSTKDATTGACTAWTGLNMATGCSATGCLTGMTSATNAGQRSDLTIDPVTNRIIYGTFSTATPATTLVTAIQATGDCSALSSSAANWTTRTYPTANAGLNGFRLAAGTDFTYLSFLLSTTNVRVAKTTVSLGAAWSTANEVNAETTTVGQEGVGFAIDTKNGLNYTSYASVPAGAAGAAGNDIKVAYGNAADLVAAGRLVLVNVDQTMNNFPVTPTPVLSAAKAADGTVGFAYFFTELGGSPGANSKLYYGIRGGATATPSFGANLVTNFTQGSAATYVGIHPDLTYDASSNPVIAFLDTANGTGILRVARSNNRGVSFSIDQVDGISTTNTVGRFPSIQLTGTTTGISYYDFLAANLRLKFARKAATSSYDLFTIDGPNNACAGQPTPSDAGSYSNLKWTSTGRPVIAYQATVGGVKYLRIAYAADAATSATFTWKCLTLDTTGQGIANRGEGIDMWLDSTNKPHIAHYDSTIGAIRYVTCSSDIATCMTTGASAFTSTRVGVVGAATAISSKPGIRVNSSGTIYLTYSPPQTKVSCLQAKTAPRPRGRQKLSIRLRRQGLASRQQLGSTQVCF